MAKPVPSSNKSSIDYWYDQAVDLLQQLISIPSFSKEESETANAISDFLKKHGAQPQSVGNNILAVPHHFDPEKPTILLNSHHDTVKPNPNYTKDPFQPLVEDGKLYGLGSNDAGGCLVALIVTYLFFEQHPLPAFNIILVASAEEEISGKGGIEFFLASTPASSLKIDFAIVGEPTLLQMAIAERGLMVVDGVYHGIAGHAAREEGESALLKFVKDLASFDAAKTFTKVSPFLGPVKVSCTVASTDNKAHNVVPATCNFVLDCRINECYTFEEVLGSLRTCFNADLQPRSMRLKSSIIPEDHPLIVSGKKMGKSIYGSPTTSDKALMPFTALKMGPGDSARSHTADEFIYLEEIRQGIHDYIHILQGISV